MKLLIIHAHPSGKSFNRALLDSFLEGAKTAGHSIDLLDLYEEKFDPVLKAPELKGGPGEGIKAYQERIKKADWLVFIYPIWWYRAPAILEGWIDRVFTVGFAYRFKKIIGTLGKSVGLLPDKKALVIETYGSPGWTYKLFYGNWGWKRFKRGVLGLFGIRKVIHFPCYAVPFVTDEKREKWLEQVKKLAGKLK